MAESEAPADVEGGQQTQPGALDTEKGDLQKASGKGGGPISALPATLCGLSQIVYLSIAAVSAIFFFIVLPVVLTLPQVVSCHVDDESYYVVLVPEPTIVNVEPSMICIAESDRTVKVTGGAFLDYNGAVPSVQVNNASLPINGSMRSCATQDVRSQDVQLCAEFDVTIPNATNLTNFSYFPFVLTNPVPPKEHPLADVTESPPCEVLAKGLLTVVPPPAIVDVFPPVICSATNMVTISGEWFPTFTLNATQVTSKPLVELNGNLAPASDLNLSSCVGFEAHNYVNCSLCNTIEMALNASSFTINAAVNVSLTTPAPLNCSVPRTNNFVVVARPSLMFVSPNLVCNDGVNATVITLNGANFLKVDGKHANYSLMVMNQTYALSVVSDAGCNALSIPMSSHNASLCSNVTVSIPPFAAPLGLSAASINIVTPATPECGVSFASMLYFAPNPTINMISPPAVCQGTQSNTTNTNLTLHGVGSAFLRYNAANPAIELNNVSFLGPQVMENCTTAVSIPSASGTDSVQMCESITVGLNYSEIESMSLGAQMFKITQPAPISCSYTDSWSFNLIGPAKIYSINPSSLCAGEQNVLILNGSSLNANTSISLVMGNTTLTPSQQTYINSQTLSVVFDSAGLIEGTWQLQAVNLAAGCSTLELKTLTVKPKMFVFFVDPPVVYNGLQLQATVYTSGTDNSNPANSLTFTRLNSGAGVCSNPAFTTQAACSAVYTNASCSNPVLMNQTECEATNTWNGTNCSNGLLMTQAECTKINLWTAGFCSHPLLNVSECSQNNTWTFYAIGVCSNPVFTSATTCQQKNVWLGRACSNLLLTTQADCEASNNWTFYSPGTCTGNTTLAYEQCLSAGLTWNATNTSETYTSMTFNSSVLVQKGSKIQVVLPAGFSVGDWQITVFRSDGCQSTLEGGVNVVANTVLSLVSVNPTRAWSLGNTAVTLQATSTASLAPGQVNFRSTPRVFLAPSGQVGTCTNASGVVTSNSTTQANCNGTFSPIAALGVSLTALVYVDSSSLQGIIQSHFCSGPYTTQASCVNASETWTELVVGASYNLIVINPPPLSEVGVLADAVVVVASPPPIIRSVSPDYVSGSAVHTVNVLGENFLYPATATITCTPAFSANSTSLNGISPTQFNVTFTFPPPRSVCLVQVTNADGSSFVYSSVTTTTGTNIVPFTASNFSLITPRRGAEIVVASPASTQKFMYVIGGDSVPNISVVPANGSGVTTVEYVPLNFDGTPASAFKVQRHPFPAPVSHGRAAVMGRFIYYFGGHDTNTSKATNVVYRAQILDPLNAPSLQLTLNILNNVSSSLTAGLWYYRVAAVFANSSTPEYEFWSGPMGSGETSASDVLSIRLPALASMQLSLTWNPFPGASEYRLYRSPLANRPAGQLGLLYQGPATNYQDLGGPVDLTQTPVPLGQLSHWAVVSTPLASARARGGLVLVPPTPSNPNQVCAFIIGGASSWSDASVANNIERYCATVNKATSLTATETHALQTSANAYTPNATTVSIFTGGWGNDAALVTPADNSFLAPTQRLLLLSTRLPGNVEGAQVRVIEVYQNATLATGSYSIASDISPNYRHGAFFNTIGGQAFALGGVIKTGTTAEKAGVSGAWAAGNPLTTNNWNSYGGGTLVVPAAYFGHVKFGPFLLAAGGCNGTAVSSVVQSSYCCG